LVPLALTYGSKVKLNIGLAKGKNTVDKRDTLKQRDIQRDVQRQIRDA